MEKTDWQALVDRHPSMSKEERDALLGRVSRMKEALKSATGLKALWNKQNVDY
jgi:hypothetical protein